MLTTEAPEIHDRNTQRRLSFCFSTKLEFKGEVNHRVDREFPEKCKKVEDSEKTEKSENELCLQNRMNLYVYEEQGR